MKKVLVNMGVIALVGGAFTAGWFASRVQSNSAPKVQTPQNIQGTTATSTKTIINVETGTGMTTSDMYDELQKISGADFDRRYTMYALLMRSDLVAISRLAKEKAVNEEIKTKATRMWTDDFPIVSELYNLQHRLGYSHH